MARARVVCATVVGAFVVVGASAASTPATTAQPTFPIHAAFYYPWFPEAWKQNGMYPFSHYVPSAGLYDETQTATQKRQIADMRYAGMNVAIASWWGQGSRTDQRIGPLLATTRAMGSSLKWSLYYEAEGQTNPTVSQIVSDLRYIQSHYAGDSAFFKVNGRFVVFVYGQSGDAGGMAARWKQASDTIGHAAYIVLKAFTGYKSYAADADSWHQYGPANAESSISGYSFGVSPGFWRADQSTPVLGRDITRFRKNVADMVNSHAPWQLVTTYNEWGEGTATESSKSWSSSSGHGLYIDALHNALTQSTTTAALTAR